MPLGFAEIERAIVDYFDRHEVEVEERGSEWFLIDDEQDTVSLTGLAAMIFRLTSGERA